jgi:hypothetical protein
LKTRDIATPADVADYSATLLQQLITMTKRSGLPILAHLLDLARAEALYEASVTSRTAPIDAKSSDGTQQ